MSIPGLKLLFFAAFLALSAFCWGQGRASPDRAEQVMKALAAAYPGRVGQAEFRDGDWALSVWGVRYYYCGGRLLPEGLRASTEEYSPQPFYNYLPELPPWKEPSPEEAERYRNMAGSRGRNPVKRSPAFFDALWQAGSKDEAQKRVKTVNFLGSSVTVHEAIAENLSRVERQILAEAGKAPLVRAWVDNIKSMEAWSWRNIADTQTRSFHSYGIAIDILPGSLGGKESYWLWTVRTKPEWWNIPYEQRLHPPAAVIKAFESQGFIWGGKWLFFDTMHFEYRPEILILSAVR
jgi:hypothetical protein